MEGSNGLGVSSHGDIISVHIDVITITLSTPKAHQASPPQTAAVDHLTEHSLSVIEDSPRLLTCGTEMLLSSDWKIWFHFRLFTPLSKVFPKHISNFCNLFQTLE